MTNFEERRLVFGFQFLVLLYGAFGVISRLNHLQVGVEDEESRRSCKHSQHEDEIFEEQIDQLRIAHLLLLDK